MAERAVTIQPGAVTPLGDTLRAGTGINNLDPVNGVWVSTSPGVIPGIGTRVGPLGYTTWQGGPGYVCVDTSVNAPVNLTISDNAVNPVNPVDIATATANAINAQGIPNVLTGKVVYSTGVPLLTYPTIDVSGFASVSITINMSGPGYIYYWFEDVNGYTTSGYRQISIAAACSASITAPVTGPILYMGMSASTGATAAVYASNRVLPATFSFGGNPTSQSGWADNVTFAWVNGTVQAIGNRLLSTNGGMHFARFNMAGTGGGYMKCSDFTNIFPPNQNFTVVDSGAFHAGPSSTLEVQMMINFPPGLHRILFLPTVSGTYNVGGVIIPVT